MNPYVSVVIPAYNEETNIRLGALEKVARFMERQTYGWEVLLTDDGSTDGTYKLLEQFSRANKGFMVIRNPHQGKAMTVIAGMMEARGDLILFSDLDQATPIYEIDKLLPWFKRGFDVVIGSRNNRREGAPLTRRVMARGFMWLRSILLGLNGITDTQCGFKAFRRPVAREIFGKLKLYGEKRVVKGSMVTAGFDIEVLFIAKKIGFSIKEVPVEWHYVETRRVSTIKDSWQGLTDVLRIRVNTLLGLYR